MSAHAANAMRAILIGLALVVASGTASAAMYKWVDEKGVVHYTDKMPPEAVDRGNVELSKQGVPIKKVDPSLTPEQRRAKEQEEERKRAVAKQQEDTARRDRALLASYTSENEIDLARQRALNAIESVMRSSAAYVESINKRKAEVQERIATFKDRPVPPVLERERDSLNEELDRQNEVMAIKRNEASAVNARYDADKARWREITAARAAEASAAGMTPTAARK